MGQETCPLFLLVGLVCVGVFVTDGGDAQISDDGGDGV